MIIEPGQNWQALTPNGQVSQYNIQSPYQTMAQTDSQFEQGGISGTKFDQFTFDQGFGGTLTLGGLNNDNGILNIRDANKNIIERDDNLGSHYFDTSGHELVRVDTTGLHTYDSSGNILTQFINTGAYIYGQATLQFRNSATSPIAGIAGISNTGQFFIGSDNANPLELAGASSALLAALGGDLNLEASGNVVISPLGNLYYLDRKIYFSSSAHDYEFGLSGGQPTLLFDGNLKTAIVPTKKDGYRALYTNESPDVWFMDFARVKPKPWWKFWQKKSIICDTMFLEVTEPPYITMPTTDKNLVQVWGKRKGFANIRFEKKTKKEFEENNKFWATPIDKAKNKT